MSFWKQLFGGSKTETTSNQAKARQETPLTQTPSPPKSTSLTTPPSDQRPATPVPQKAEIDNQLIEAIKEQSVDKVQTLLAAGANPNTKAKYSHHGKWMNGMAAAIHFAIPDSFADDKNEQACLQIIDLLLKSGADINAPGADGFSSEDGPFTALMNAVGNYAESGTKLTSTAKFSHYVSLVQTRTYQVISIEEACKRM